MEYVDSPFSCFFWKTDLRFSSLCLFGAPPEGRLDELLDRDRLMSFFSDKATKRAVKPIDFEDLMLPAAQTLNSYVGISSFQSIQEKLAVKYSIKIPPGTLSVLRCENNWRTLANFQCEVSPRLGGVLEMPVPTFEDVQPAHVLKPFK